MCTRLLHIALLIFCAMISVEVDARQFTLVIDAGHGGKDHGAIGKNAREKDINLAVALRFGQLVEENMDSVRVVYTRDRDVFVELQQRANIANAAGGDLFVSVHTNSVAKSNKNRTKVKGAETYTLGLHRTNENLEVAKRENSVISLESDYTSRYEGFDPNSSESYIIFELNQDRHLSQSVSFASMVQQEFVSTAGRTDNGVRQAGFLVLARTAMPAVLVELDFICNPEQESFLSSKKGQNKLGQALYNAFSRYLESIRFNSSATGAGVTGNPRPATIERPADTSSPVVYRVQFLTNETKLSETSKRFKGLSPIYCYKHEGRYKYTYGETTDEQEAQKILKRVKKKFKDAFIVAFRDGHRVPL